MAGSLQSRKCSYLQYHVQQPADPVVPRLPMTGVLLGPSKSGKTAGAHQHDPRAVSGMLCPRLRRIAQHQTSMIPGVRSRIWIYATACLGLEAVVDARGSVVTLILALEVISALRLARFWFGEQWTVDDYWSDCFGFCLSAVTPGLHS